jgi:oligoendopeptidase F
VSDIYQTTRWSLQDLNLDPNDNSITHQIELLDKQLQSFENNKSFLSIDIKESDFLNILNQYESINRTSQRLGGFAYLWFYEDTQNPAALSLRSRVDQALASASNRIFFFEFWFKGLDDDTAQRLMDASGDIRYFLQNLRNFKPFTLSEPEEKIITLKDVNGIDAMVGLYEMITNRYSFHLEVNGEQKTFTRDGLSAYLRHPKPDLRERAYQELNRVYTNDSTLLAQIYNHRVQDWHTEAITLRGFKSPIAARNLLNDIPDEVVDTLLSACRKNASLFHRYFELKARWLNVDKLRRYDIYAPLAPSQTQYNFNDALELVFDSFQDFSPIAAENAQKVVREAHLDSELRTGKRGGAFCYSVLPEYTPWVLVNFAGQARDVATIAHELGHAIHALLAKDHSLLTYSPSLPLAETASVFSEMLLTERLLSVVSDPDTRRDLLSHAIDDAYATIIRQAFFTIFELDAHQIIADGATFDEVASHYMENLTEQFGDSLELSDDFRWEWVSIPHIYRSPFYTYAYSFGQLLVLALYQQYRTYGPSFVPTYLKILSYGGSASPAHILGEAGVDMTSYEFWQGGFDVLSGMLQTLESL